MSDEEPRVSLSPSTINADADADADAEAEADTDADHHLNQGSTKLDDSTTDDDVPYFPIEIISQILSCLPLSSILRFKSVCKAWQALIETPEFDTSVTLLKLARGR